MKAMLMKLAHSARIRKDVLDIAKVIAGVIAAKYGIKLA